MARLGHLILKVLPIKASFIIENANVKAIAAKDNVIDYMGQRFASLALLLPPCFGKSLVAKLPSTISDKVKVNIRNTKKKGDNYNNNNNLEKKDEEVWRNYVDTRIDIDDNNEINNNNNGINSNNNDTNIANKEPTPWFGNISQIIGEIMNPSRTLSLTESEAIIVDELGIGNSLLASKSKDACLIESDDDDDVSKIEESYQTLSNGRLWPESHRKKPIKRLANGAKLLELAPWTWRSHPLLHYNLTGDPDVVRKLFALGYEDAQANANDLNKFFKR